MRNVYSLGLMGGFSVTGLASPPCACTKPSGPIGWCLFFSYPFSTMDKDKIGALARVVVNPVSLWVRAIILWELAMRNC